MENCIFCKIANGEIPAATLYEDEDFRVILDLGPATKGHALVLPKKHAANLYELPDELAAKAMGINVIRIKMTAFLLSVALTAYSGCLYAFYMSYVDPTGFGWKKSADWVIMVFFGGVNSLTGSTLGAFILSALPQVLRGLQNYRYVIYAVLVLLIINFKPSGLLGEWEFTPRDIARSARKLKRKLGLKKEEN